MENISESMISPLASVSPDAKIGKEVKIHPFALIDAGVEIGDGCEIMSYAAILKGTRLGRNNRVYHGAIIGADPQDFRWDGCESHVEIGDDNVIREHVIINRSIHPEGATRIADNTFIMAESHIGHDSRVDDSCVVGNNVTIAGNAEIGKFTILSSGVIIHENSRVGDWVLIKGGCRIDGNVPPFVIMAHNPASYYGVNAFVMRKGKFTDGEIDDVAKAYRHVYQTQTSVFNALKRIDADVAPGKIRDSITGFIRAANMKLVAIPRDLE